MSCERWADSVAENGDELWMLEKHNDLKLFMIKDKASYNDPFGRNPSYSVWNGDKWEYCGQNYQYAWKKFCEIKQEMEAMDREAG